MSGYVLLCCGTLYTVCQFQLICSQFFFVVVVVVVVHFLILNSSKPPTAATILGVYRTVTMVQVLFSSVTWLLATVMFDKTRQL